MVRVLPAGDTALTVEFGSTISDDSLARVRRLDAALAAHIDDPGVRAFLLQSLDLRSDPPRWRLNLDTLAAEMPRIIGWPDVSGSHDGPTLFLSGGDSDYVLPEHRARIRAFFPAARLAKLPGAGHWRHADAPRPFEASARMWFDAG